MSDKCTHEGTCNEYDSVQAMGSGEDEDIEDRVDEWITNGRVI